MKKTLIVILAFAVGVAVAMAAFYLLAPKKEEAKGVEPQSGAQPPPPKSKADLVIETMVPGNNATIGEPKRA
jgi:flagellar basal body-associated protein FliL